MPVGRWRTVVGRRCLLLAFRWRSPLEFSLSFPQLGPQLALCCSRVDIFQMVFRLGPRQASGSPEYIWRRRVLVGFMRFEGESRWAGFEWIQPIFHHQTLEAYQSTNLGRPWLRWHPAAQVWEPSCKVWIGLGRGWPSRSLSWRAGPFQMTWRWCRGPCAELLCFLWRARPELCVPSPLHVRRAQENELQTW